MATVGALSGSSAQSSTGSAGGLSALTSEQFAQIIFTELSKQDPLQPNDTNALLQQISTLRDIQSSMDLSTQLKQLVTQNEFASATTMIGKRVSGLSQDLARVSGVVASVSRTADGAVVTLNSGQHIPVQDLDEIIGEATSPAAGSGS